MMAQDTMKKRKVFAYKIHAPKLDMVEQGLDNLSPLLRSESLIRLLLTRAWCYFCAHMYSEAERCVDQGIELCLQMRSRTRWSIYTLAAMFTAHQIYLCNHADQKAAAVSQTNRSNRILVFSKPQFFSHTLSIQRCRSNLCCY